MRLLRTILVASLAMVFSASLVFSAPPTRVLKASPKAPPEVEKAEKEAKQKHEEPRKEKLTKKELEAELNKIPGEREKLEKAKKGFKPTSSVFGEKGFSLSWLNPFSVSEASAQTTANVYLTPGNYYYSSDPLAYAIFYAIVRSGSWSYAKYYPRLSNYNNYKGYVYFYYRAPSAGWYAITIRASHRKPATLQHHEQDAYGKYGYINVASWTVAQLPSSIWNNYPTFQYLEAGSHGFRWHPDPPYTSVYSVQITFMYP